MTNPLIPVLVTGGLGAAIGSIATAVVEATSKRGESRATAADRVSNAAGNLADRLDRMNVQLDKENEQIRAAVIALGDAMEEVIPLLPDDVAREKAISALRASRLALR